MPESRGQAPEQQARLVLHLPGPGRLEPELAGSHPPPVRARLAQAPAHLVRGRQARQATKRPGEPECPRLEQPVPRALPERLAPTVRKMAERPSAWCLPAC